MAQEIVTIGADVSTADHMHDGDAVKPLLEQVEQEVNAFYGDGAYDQWKVRDYLQEEKIAQVIPPRKNAVIQQHGNSKAEPLECAECLRQIRRDGKKAWKELIGYHRLSLAETAMSRMKGSFGEWLKNRSGHSQIIESALRCKILNAFSSTSVCLQHLRLGSRA